MRSRRVGRVEVTRAPLVGEEVRVLAGSILPNSNLGDIEISKHLKSTNE
jgi:hypothetical protein